MKKNEEIREESPEKEENEENEKNEKNEENEKNQKNEKNEKNEKNQKNEENEENEKNRENEENRENKEENSKEELIKLNKFVEIGFHKEKSSVNYKDFAPISDFTLLKPHLLSFFLHVYIDSSKIFEDFSKFLPNFCKLVEKERNRLETLVTYKLDFPEFLLGKLLKNFTKLINILRTESLMIDEENKEDSGKFFDVFKDFANSLLKTLMGRTFDKDTVISSIFPLVNTHFLSRFFYIYRIFTISSGFLI